ncbi:DUF91 domain-containing protein [Paraburkholderia sabiae]|uniref:endonuclease NucS domain-containing protein n=1 Tax=Paraburkholderia sabiae TaxID=273251 RepID=UPI001CB23CDA|nr:endonuclease NucS domain-containing protein [Paraburkholderia sabiae]CAG9237348.1 DUF91 domain-containing protein [Paraburkholderia sabiae]
MIKPVLGLYNNEDELRNDIANKLNLVESGLTLIQRNYAIENRQGADGSFDILAKDEFSNFVIIEVKRSDKTARQTLHELSKYVALFVEIQAVDQHKVRCFVISTHWHELDIPLAFYKKISPVDVKAFSAANENNAITILERHLPEIDLLPKLSPEVRFSYFESEQLMRQHASDLEVALKDIDYLRAALILTEPRHNDISAPAFSNRYRSILCIWRIHDSFLDRAQSLTSTTRRSYFFPGWEVECDVVDWLLTKGRGSDNVFRELQRATPEKISALQQSHNFKELFRLGNWPKNDLVNDLKEVTRSLLAKDVLSTSHRVNRYLFEAQSSPKTGKAWDYTVSAFSSFLSFSEFWVNEISTFLRDIPKNSVATFYAHDGRHFYYAIHQHLANPNADLSCFKIEVKDGDEIISSLIGAWAWDENTFPNILSKNVEDTYGSLTWAKLALLSSVDTNRYEFAHYLHGFWPYVLMINHAQNSGNIIMQDNYPDLDYKVGLVDFVARNSSYCKEISDFYHDIPANSKAGSGAFFVEF